MEKCLESFKNNLPPHFSGDEVAKSIWAMAWIKSREQAFDDLEKKLEEMRNEKVDG
jgi:hypothetical protein